MHKLPDYRCHCTKCNRAAAEKTAINSLLVGIIALVFTGMSMGVALFYDDTGGFLVATGACVVMMVAFTVFAYFDKISQN